MRTKRVVFVFFALCAECKVSIAEIKKVIINLNAIVGSILVLVMPTLHNCLHKRLSMREDLS